MQEKNAIFEKIFTCPPGQLIHFAEAKSAIAPSARGQRFKAELCLSACGTLRRSFITFIFLDEEPSA